MPEENTGLPRGWGEINKEPSASEWGPSFVEEAPLATPNSLPTDSPEVFNATKKGSNLPVKKILIGFLAVLIVGVLGFAVYKFALPKLKTVQKKEVTLTYWGLWETPETFKEILADWEKTHPNIKVEYSRQSPKEYRERLQSAMDQGKAPDMFRVHATWLPMLKNEMEPVPAAVLSASTLESAYYPVMKKSLVVNGNVMAVPLMVDTLSLFYNTDIFRLGGKEPPKTWDELRQTAVDLMTLGEAGEIQTAGVALGTTTNVEHWSDILGLLILQDGANPDNPTDPLIEDAIKFYLNFSKTDQVWNETLPNSTLAFAQGKVAMYFGYSWDVFEIKALNPSLNFKVVPVPQLGNDNVNWASFWVEGVAKDSPNKEAAWEFMKYLSSQATLEKNYQSQSKIRLFGEIYPRSDMADKVRSNTYVAPFVQQAATASTWYLCSRTFDNGLNDKIIQYYQDAVNAASQGKSLTDTLKTTDNGVSQLLSRYGISGKP